MAVLQLRNHIPIGSPARREPVTGDEPVLRVSPGFEPEWYAARCGADFSESWHLDPRVRCESRRRMKAELNRAFPECDYWDAANGAEFAGLSGCFGIGVIPSVFGMPLRFHSHRWPELEPGHLLDDRQVEGLNVDRLLDGPFVDALFRQMDVIQREWGQVRGYLNWQGVLNNAFHLRGQQLFVDLAESPELADHLLSVVAGVMIKLAAMVQARQRASGFDVDEFCVSNCTVNMISPRMYTRYVAPHDARIAQVFAHFGVHTCNWDVTPYAGELAKLPRVGYIDMGMQSNFARVKEALPHARRAVLYTVSRLSEATAAELRADIDRLRNELAPCDLVLADLPLSLPDSRFREFLALAR
ncbi:MAG: hypothetical protein HZB13_08665 [Acidobacteria bacterium]|nr:hypothetical protein [Acidobacteriota bacterium]